MIYSPLRPLTNGMAAAVFAPAVSMLENGILTGQKRKIERKEKREKPATEYYDWILLPVFSNTLSFHCPFPSVVASAID